MIKLKHILISIVWGFIPVTQAQHTAIPDPVFEQYLIDFGFDSDATINGQVLTSDIEFITSLQINESPPFYFINDLTGIQDFTSLEHLFVVGIECTALNFGDLNNLTYFEGISNTNLTSVDLSQCENIATILLSDSNISSIELPQSPSLVSFVCRNAQLTSLDLSEYPNLTTVSVAQNALETLIITNENNTNITSFNATNNPILSCIIVDDAVYSQNNWLNIDSTTTFVETQEECEALSIGEVPNIEMKIYPNPASQFFRVESNQEITNVTIIDITGKVVKFFKQHLETYPVTDLSEGLYIVTIETNLGKSTQKLIVK
ncbi:T9SS type A sorting domain-containing protein [uncultured Dokdonia sp.]|uniref:T9SS type A sorting domain-containing protein n=1 Tax=uncultured Dokdonia sp. TaxID=575653 RepID=UPI002622558B|nr:T9SS type A sorting domain-containing protein [uncultured Dokdonia sp.]